MGFGSARRIIEFMADEESTNSNAPMLVDIFVTRLAQTGEVSIVKWKPDECYYIGKPEQWCRLSRHIAERLIKYFAITFEKEEGFFEWYRPTTVLDCCETLMRRLDSLGEEFAATA